jgi:predicted DCC family thiol-disulfide oxidoreductase YuxK
LIPEKQIIIFDGICNFCNFWVDFIIKRDEKDLFRFAALQSKFSKKFLSKTDSAISNTDSIMLVIEGKIYKKSTAVLKVSKEIQSPVRFLYPLIYLPEFFRDFIYDFIAENRYKIFGKRDTCRLPTNDEKEKFLS